MPNTITSITGAVFHKFMLAEPSFWAPEESISFSELENDLGDGYSASVLFGANTGLRRWRLKLPTLATEIVPLVTGGINGADLTREQYLWELFTYTKTTGKPFVFRSPRNGQFYFVRFADKELSYQKMRVRLYSTGVEFKQVRLANEAVFVPYRPTDAQDAYSPLSIGGSGVDPLDFWLKGTPIDNGGDGNGFNDTGDVIETTLNGIPIARFNSVAPGTGYWDAQDPGGQDYYDIFILMKVREGTFHATRKTVMAESGGAVLEGTPAGTTFLDLSLGNGFEYRLDGALYDDDDQQAPMNTWGVVHIHFADGMNMTDMMFGIDDSSSGNFDIAEVMAFNIPIPETTINETMEYLTAIAAQLNG